MPLGDAPSAEPRLGILFGAISEEVQHLNSGFGQKQVWKRKREVPFDPESQ